MVTQGMAGTGVWQDKCGVSHPTDSMSSEIFNGFRNRVQEEELPQGCTRLQPPGRNSAVPWYLCGAR